MLINNKDNDTKSDDMPVIDDGKLNDNIKVMIRIKPLLGNDIINKVKTCVKVDANGKSLMIKGKKTKFNFDYIATGDAKQEEIFDAIGKKIVNSCLDGYNGTIFGYGQSGAGKTYTLLGELNNNYNKGLLPRIFDYLFAQINSQRLRFGNDTIKYDIGLSCLEIYNETIHDLLADTNNVLNIREHGKKGIYVEALSINMVEKETQCLEYLKEACQKRRIGGTKMNDMSSRSHLVFTLYINCIDQRTHMIKKRLGKLNLIDLAGSERQGKTGAKDLKLKEASNINKSLLQLGQVMKGLSTKKSYINFRNTKITYLLKDSLSGNSLTAFICNISPSIANEAETISTLHMATHIKKIKNCAQLNDVIIIISI